MERIVAYAVFRATGDAGAETEWGLEDRILREREGTDLGWTVGVFKECPARADLWDTWPIPAPGALDTVCVRVTRSIVVKGVAYGNDGAKRLPVVANATYLSIKVWLAERIYRWLPRAPEGWRASPKQMPLELVLPAIREAAHHVSPPPRCRR